MQVQNWCFTQGIYLALGIVLQVCSQVCTWFDACEAGKGTGRLAQNGKIDCSYSKYVVEPNDQATAEISSILVPLKGLNPSSHLSMILNDSCESMESYVVPGLKLWDEIFGYEEKH